VLSLWFMIPMVFPMAWNMLLLWPECWDDSMVWTLCCPLSAVFVYACLHDTSMLASMAHLWATKRGVSL
jgi:hypothetical protein